MPSELEMREMANRTVSSLAMAFESRRAHLIEMRDYFLPRHAPDLEGESNSRAKSGEKKGQNLYDAGHLRNVRNAAAGMHSGLTSPNRPWFKLGFGIEAIDDDDEVKAWLHEVERRMYAIFQTSNIYEALHHGYTEIIVFGTTAIAIMEDYETVIRARNFTMGEYYLGANASGRVDKFIRMARFTATEMIDEFGEDRVSQAVKTAKQQNNHHSVFQVYQLICKRTKENNLPQVLGRDWVSIWWEKSATENSLLRVGGYDEFPILTPRWEVVGDNVYGEAPAMDVLPDVKTLQKMVKTVLVATDKLVNPPVKADGALRGTEINTMPGGVTFVDDYNGGEGGLTPLYRGGMTFDVAAAHKMIFDLKNLVAEGLFADLFRMLQFSGSAKMTATEVAERQQEKLLLLGPVIERVHSEQLDPLINRTFSIMAREGLLPEPPQSIQGQEIRVQYISILAQAQKLAGISAVEQFFGFVSNAATIDQGVLDAVDLSEGVREYGARLGVNPALIKSRKIVEEMRAVRAKQAQQAQQMQDALMAAEGAKTLSQADMEGDNALTTLGRSLVA